MLNLRNVCSLVSGLPIRFRSVRDTATLRMRRESSGAPLASLVYNVVDRMGSLEQRLFSRMVLRHDCYV